jgi:hypothetical protein
MLTLDPRARAVAKHVLGLNRTNKADNQRPDADNDRPDAENCRPAGEGIASPRTSALFPDKEVR